jgi:hypothetical protein
VESWVRAELKRSSARVPVFEPAGPPEVVAERGLDVKAPTGTQPSPPSVQAATVLLFGPALEADLETDTGQVVTVQLERATAGQVVGIVPRLTVTPGMTLSGRVVDEDRNPWRLRFVCHDALEQTADSTARVTLIPTKLSNDDQRRVSRIDIDATIMLRVVKSVHLRGGDELSGQIVNLAPTGFAFTSRDELSRGDRVTFHARFFEGEIDGEARVASLHQGSLARIVGCWFVTMDDASEEVIHSVFDRVHESGSPFSVPALRELIYHPDCESSTAPPGFGRIRELAHSLNPKRWSGPA